MPGQLTNVTTADKYTDPNSVRWQQTIELALQVGNAAVFMQVDKSAEGIGEWGADELFIAPVVGVLALRCSGVRFRSAVAGKPAQVTAQLFNDGETLGGGQLAPFTGVVSPSGGISQAPALTAFYKGGVLVGSESGLNLIEGAGATVAMVDNPGANRVDVTLASLVAFLRNSVAVSSRQGLNLIEGSGIAVAMADNAGGNRVDTTLSAPAGVEIAYNEFTADVIVSGAGEGTATTIVTASAFTFNGSSPVIIEFFAVAALAPATSDEVSFWLYQDGSSIGRLGRVQDPANAVGRWPVMLRRRMVPTAASHTYSIRASRVTSNWTIQAGVGGLGNAMPGYIRIEQVS